jgi:hypothetical protein
VFSKLTSVKFKPHISKFRIYYKGEVLSIHGHQAWDTMGDMIQMLAYKVHLITSDFKKETATPCPSPLELVSMFLEHPDILVCESTELIKKNEVKNALKDSSDPYK